MAIETKLGDFLVRWSTREDGDFARTASNVQLTRKIFEPGEWNYLEQVHGENVAVVNYPGEHLGVKADAMVTNNSDCLLAIQTADCLSIALVGDNGTFAAVHAGWKGLLSGIIENTAEIMRELGAKTILGASGPAIGEECYEFGENELELMVTKFGESVRTTTSAGKPALSLRSTLTESAKQADIELKEINNDCTACLSDQYFSHRARSESERMAMIVRC